MNRSRDRDVVRMDHGVEPAQYNVSIYFHIKSAFCAFKHHIASNDKVPEPVSCKLTECFLRRNFLIPSTVLPHDG